MQQLGFLVLCSTLVLGLGASVDNQETKKLEQLRTLLEKVVKDNTQTGDSVDATKDSADVTNDETDAQLRGLDEQLDEASPDGAANNVDYIEARDLDTGEAALDDQTEDEGPYRTVDDVDARDLDAAARDVQATDPIDAVLADDVEDDVQSRGLDAGEEEDAAGDSETLNEEQERDLDSTESEDGATEGGNSTETRALDGGEEQDLEERGLKTAYYGNTVCKRRYMDKWSNALYIPEPTRTLRAGYIRSWKFYAQRRGVLYLQVWRRSGSRYYTLVGQTRKRIYRKGTQTVRARINVKSGDVIGFYFPGKSIVPFSGWECYGRRTLYVKSPRGVRNGVRFYFRYKSAGWNPCRRYSFGAYLRYRTKTNGGGNQWVGNRPTNRGELDSWSNAMYIPNPDKRIPADGTIRRWRFYARRTSPIYLQVFRKVYGRRYRLVAQTLAVPRRIGRQFLTTRLRVKRGDVIGFYFTKSSVVPFLGSYSCYPVGRRGLYVSRPSNVRVGAYFSFSTMQYGWRTCRQYAVGALLSKDQKKRGMESDDEKEEDSWFVAE